MDVREGERENTQVNVFKNENRTPELSFVCNLDVIKVVDEGEISNIERQKEY